MILKCHGCKNIALYLQEERSKKNSGANVARVYYAKISLLYVMISLAGI